MKKRKSLIVLLIITLLCTLLFGCKSSTSGQAFAPKEKLGFKGRTFYEIFVRSFNDSNGDGIGDLKGVTQKLDYLSGLGVKGIWLMPVNSSQSYHGYDVTDYYNINSQYGTLEDLKQLIQEAHKRDILVAMDLVLNHTSDQHPWFLDAVKDKNSKYRDYYIWSDSKTDVNESSPISAQPWVPIGDDHYYALFWKGMPDLNYDNKAVREEAKKVSKFYLDMGVDGFRLDAARWIYNDDSKNVEWWKEFNSYVKSVNKNAFLVGEVWDSSPDVIAPYFAGLDACFNFPVRDALASGISGKSFDMALGTLVYSHEAYAKYNKDYTDAPFLNNHDINRVMSDVQDVEAYKKAAAVLLTLPGTPFIYYGEELGMLGAKPDESIREPFLWDTDSSKNTSWEASTNDAAKIAVSVEEKDKNSLLNLYKAFIKLRNENTALLTGDLKLLEGGSSGVTAFKRSDASEDVYVFVNLNADEVKQPIDIDKAEVIYSSARKTGNIKFSKGQLALKGNEILVVRKAAKN